MDEPRPFYRDPKNQAILVVVYAALLYLFTLGRQGAAREVLISGGTAYVSVSSDGGVRILSVQNPAIPAEVGYFDTPGSALKMALQGSLLYVADGERGLRILNVFNPSAPVEIGALELSGSALDVTVLGQYAYLAQGSDGVAVADISDPSAPFLVHRMDTPGEAKALAAADVLLSTPDGSQQIQAPLLYVAEGEVGIGIYDFLNPRQPAPLSYFDTPGDAMDLVLGGPYAFVADGQDGIQIINVSSPVAPVLAGAFDQGGNAQSLDLSGNRIYFAQGRRGFSEIDLSNLQAPVLVSRVDTPGDALSVAAQGPLAYVADTASAGVFRNPHMFTKVAGPGVVFTDRPEYLAGTVDLHPQASGIGPREGEDPFVLRQEDETQEEYEARQDRRFDTSGLTQDGVEVVPNISVVFHLDSFPGEGRTRFGFRPESVRRAVAGEAVNPDADANSDARRVSWTWFPVRMVFSVYRGAGRAAPGPELQQPYPFDEESILALVYRQGTGPWVDAVRNMIRSELRNFISRHTLNEFLAYSDGSTSPDQFVGRDEITDLFFDFTSGFAKRARESGIQLDWIGVGTWVTPSEIIPERHLEAWRLSGENRIRASEPNLRRIRNESRVSELLRLIDQIPATFYDLIQKNLTSEQIIRRMILTYREKLHLARGLYEEQNQPVPPELDAVIRHLTSLAAIRMSANP